MQSAMADFMKKGVEVMRFRVQCVVRFLVRFAMALGAGELKSPVQSTMADFMKKELKC